MPACAPTVVAKLGQPASVSATIAEVTLSMPSPPYSSGTSTPSSPSSPTSRRKRSTSGLPFSSTLCSISSARGMTSFCMNLRVVSPNSRCVSEKSSGVNIRPSGR